MEGVRRRAARKKALPCHRVPLSGVKRKVSSCIVMWLSESEWVKRLYTLSGIAGDGLHRLGSYVREMPRSSREEEKDETGESDEEL